MADSMLVFVEGSKLPKVEELRNEVKSLGLELEEWDENLIEISGFWPGQIRGEEAGFEFFAEKSDPDDLEDWEIDINELDGRNYTVELVFRTELDVEACVICIVALCKLSNAIAFDEDEELSVNSETCMQWAKEEMGYDLPFQS
jgi:hypothetical protein